MLGSEESHIVKEYCAIKVEILRSPAEAGPLGMTFTTMLNSYYFTSNKNPVIIFWAEDGFLI